MKANYEVYTGLFDKSCKFIMVDNYPSENVVFNTPCLYPLYLKNKFSVGVWRIKSNG